MTFNPNTSLLSVQGTRCRVIVSVTVPASCQFTFRRHRAKSDLVTSTFGDGINPLGPSLVSRDNSSPFLSAMLHFRYSDSAGATGYNYCCGYQSLALALKHHPQICESSTTRANIRPGSRRAEDDEEGDRVRGAAT